MRSLATLLLALVLAGPMAADATAPGPNVLLVTIDTLRVDHTSLGGYAQDTTPNLARLAERGAHFRAAYAPTASTGPTHASIFTGQYPLHHGVAKNGIALASEHRTLAERFSGAGYQTAAFVSSFVLDARFGWSQGFDHYADDFDAQRASAKLEQWQGHAVSGFDARADDTTDRVMRWLWGARDPERPFFAFVHYFDPHSPYDPPRSIERRFELPDPATVPPTQRRRGRDAAFDYRMQVRRYDAEIAYVDAELGRLLDTLSSLGLADETLIVVTADHGEGLMDHGHMMHGVHIYDEQVRVPLVVAWPDTVPAGTTLSEPVSLVDLYATLVDLARLRSDARRGDADDESGRDPGAAISFAPALTGVARLDADRPVFLQRRQYDESYVDGTYVNGEVFGLRMGPWKLVDRESEGCRELYHLGRDPGEHASLAEHEPERVAAMSGVLERWRARGASSGSPRSPVEIDEADREALRALGYAD